MNHSDKWGASSRQRKQLSAKALRQQCAWHVWGPAQRGVRLEGSERGGSGDHAGLWRPSLGLEPPPCVRITESCERG